MMRVAIRADAGSVVGWGHLKRCLALAQALRSHGAEVRIYAAAGGADVQSIARTQAFDCTVLHSALDPTEFCAVLVGRRPDLVLVDHYELAAPWHDAVRAATQAAIAVIDDLADRPLSADVVVDHNPCDDIDAKYRPVLRRRAVLCGGPRHALLDRVYADHARCTVSDTVARIGIFMGASDPDGLSALAWRACREIAGWAGPIEIATTSTNPTLPALRALAAADPQLALTVDQPHLADFHARCDLQIGAGGGALWERCCLGVPALALICAENQRQSVPLLAAAGVVRAFDAVVLSPSLLAPLGAAIADLIADADARRTLHHRSLALVDGQGADRVAATLLSLATATA